MIYYNQKLLSHPTLAFRYDRPEHFEKVLILGSFIQDAGFSIVFCFVCFFEAGLLTFLQARQLSVIYLAMVYIPIQLYFLNIISNIF
jgi:hypothetical protein